MPIHPVRSQPSTRQPAKARDALALVALLVAPGLGACAKTKRATLIAQHAASYAAIDALIQRANALVARVPEKGTTAFPRCRPNPAYVYSLRDPRHNIDFVGSRLMNSPLQDALDLRTRFAQESRLFGSNATGMEWIGTPTPRSAQARRQPRAPRTSRNACLVNRAW